MRIVLLAALAAALGVARGGAEPAGAVRDTTATAAAESSPLRIDDPHLLERLATVAPVTAHRLLMGRVDSLVEAGALTRDNIGSVEAPILAAVPDRAWTASVAATLARCVWVRPGTGPSTIVRPDVAIRFGADSVSVVLLVDRQAMRLAIFDRHGGVATSMPDDRAGWRLDGLLDQVIPEDPEVSPLTSSEPGPCDDPIEGASVTPDHAYVAPRPVVQEQPAYPETAKEDGIQGRVALRVLVGRDGLPCRVERISGPPVLADAAEEAVLEWTFEAGRLDDVPVAVWLDVPIDFRF